MTNKLQILDDEIGKHLQESMAQGELAKAASYGKPLDFGDGYSETPDEYRMGFKILKDAGFVPPEVELMQKIAAIRTQLSHGGRDGDQVELQKQLQELEVSLALVKDRMGRR